MPILKSAIKLPSRDIKCAVNCRRGERHPSRVVRTVLQLMWCAAQLTCAELTLSNVDVIIAMNSYPTVERGLMLTFHLISDHCALYSATLSPCIHPRIRLNACKNVQ
jgi:hypothetical protein